MDEQPRQLYLEDLQVGDRFTSRGHALDAAQIVAFARQFDPQPFHLDDAAAARTLFGRLAASGWHTASLTMRLLVESLPLAGGVIGSGGELQWPQPTHADDVLHVETEVLEIVPSRSKPERGMVRVLCRTLNQRGELLQSFSPRMVVSRRQVPPT